ncbi:imidazole glycerol phosphate synthase subunit HisH [Thermovenabulum gondwanense]|uniref:Imidazole glycerol phosphate synthase subunit HisH n=1 Tax=Thermovenabulum gondwanense TaxID=520767 RepID=A0A161Q9K5_9FIRM|nr:imidazole glycerol phosphate synthase subunit HisH [Thermovenabulum gondwanense]KYO64330.1 Imidazole glycerol phosphate synthase subunit HisH 1 [Thermovenabulum gondwanense]
MKKVVTLVDYGMGNLGSVKKAFEYLGFEVKLASKGFELERADCMVLPGVGAFKEAMERLKSGGIKEEIRKKVLRDKIPFLGICLGMQLLFEFSYEGESEGLSIFEGKVKLFPKKEGVKIPHMGWNKINVVKDSLLLKGLDGQYFYFVHSYYVDTTDLDLVSSLCIHGLEFTASVERENIFATQFHPEKSGEAGLYLLENFGRLL